VFFAPYYIGMDFKTRLWNNALYVGKTRTEVFFSRMLAYYAIVAMMSVVVTFFLIVMYAASIFSKVSPSVILGAFGKRILVDWAIMSIPIVWVYVFKRAVYPAFAIIATNILVIAYTFKRFAPEVSAPMAVGQMITILRIENLPSSSLYQQNAALLFAFAAVCVLLAWRRFSSCDL